MYKIETISALSDNYSYAIVNTNDNTAIIVDVPEFAPIERFLDINSLKLTDILITHHHSDHIQGVDELVQKTGAKVHGNGDDKNRLPKLDNELFAGNSYEINGINFEILKSDGHTIGCISFYAKDLTAVFTGDLLFTMGAGRMFEGTADVFFESLQKIKALPSKTMIYSGHEYTYANLEFAETVIDIDHNYKAELMAKITSFKPTVPSCLSDEINNNPFLVADTVDKFATYRKLKDNF
ncbi:MAG: hydroxyacylglutathione hydrolase [Alphaproteobacteria bacterium]